MHHHGYVGNYHFPLFVVLPAEVWVPCSDGGVAAGDPQTYIQGDKILQYLALIGPYMIILISYWPGGRAGHLPDQHHGPALALHQVADRVLYCTVLHCTVL